MIRAGLEIKGHARIPAVDSDPEGISAVCDPGGGVALIESIAEDRSAYQGFDPDFEPFPDGEGIGPIKFATDAAGSEQEGIGVATVAGSESVTEIRRRSGFGVEAGSSEEFVNHFAGLKVGGFDGEAYR